METEQEELERLRKEQAEPPANDLNAVIAQMTPDEKIAYLRKIDLDARRVIEDRKRTEEERTLVAELQQLQKAPIRNRARIAQIVKQLGWE